MRARVCTALLLRHSYFRNLHKFDAALQAKLEGYLVDLGILQAGHPRFGTTGQLDFGSPA